ncbi:HNH endonuclease [Streptomyces phage TG1]|uniref:HNH endonuclease n=1 Tax=Streptomyces phage TG1 TaxID=2927987 RepID=K4IBP0_9CAUD|nr:HNH endonuclease [Streptomyces phage TG1]AFU62224.1 HNH endonuclease [Streptomyces phage TG1]
MPHEPKCPCKPCRDKRRRAHIKSYYSKLPPDKRHELSQRKRAKAYGVDHVPYSRTAIMRRWGYRCAYCNARATHLDHVEPLSRGGADVESNMVPACADCNLSKGAKTLAEWAESFGKPSSRRLPSREVKTPTKGLPWNSRPS